MWWNMPMHAISDEYWDNGLEGNVVIVALLNGEF